MNVFENVKLAWLKNHEYNRVLAELESYKDRDLLSDLRLDRADLPHVAREAAERYGAIVVEQLQREALRRQPAVFDPFRPQPRLN